MFSKSFFCFASICQLAQLVFIFWMEWCSSCCIYSRLRKHFALCVCICVSVHVNMRQGLEHKERHDKFQVHVSYLAFLQLPKTHADTTTARWLLKELFRLKSVYVVCAVKYTHCLLCLVNHTFVLWRNFFTKEEEINPLFIFSVR